MKNFVRIQSEIDITVTAGLQREDLSNPNANVPDRLKVNPLWPKLTVDIRKGAHWYPSEIATWETVKALAKDKTLTIGEFSDTCDEDTAEKAKTELKMSMEEVEKKVSKKNLEEAAK